MCLGCDLTCQIDTFTNVYKTRLPRYLKMSKFITIQFSSIFWELFDKQKIYMFKRGTFLKILNTHIKAERNYVNEVEFH
jgi:hypothetical protein